MPDRPNPGQLSVNPEQPVKKVVLKTARKEDAKWQPKCKGTNRFGSSSYQGKRKARLERKRLKKHRKGR